ncbi:proton channel OTOP1 [Simochromis diagramma]|uniref:proton channel OTOP1 n=1 Tax=Simochromis diagramma TaxID=43689 RepID=UPI001A7F0FFF|nr:proton channel OTOP1 [Simochromis diagramma]XP_039885116.1 proton channel OTOP1 [Simochromis diagramma]XP_039885117.1 proton channel OTOP1 [Simochromis diagramma]XP_039885118.1 proton channel OTOP1 [Simochromis diagramma]XP_039885119.1 proton channel OTOP1 [Simochromis diagramma]
MPLTMVEHNGLDIMCPNKYSNSSSSSSSSEQDKKIFSKLKISLSEDYPKKNAEFLSGQYGTNLLLIGAALMLAIANKNPSVKEEDLRSFTTCLMILQLLWMMWYILVRDRQKSAPPEKDVHATSGWIRGGLTLLALLSLIMDAFRIGQYVGFQPCVSAVLVVYPVIHATHTMAQVHFLWFHIKDVIKSFETFERFGVIHAVFTNILLWCSGVMSEAEHFLNNHKRRLSALGLINLTTEYSEPQCNCTTSTCSMFATSLYYLYPFNIEYHIFVSVLLFVMWRNIGRTIDLTSNHKRQVAKNRGLILGPLVGLLALASSIGILVVYVTHVEKSIQMRRSAVSMFYIYAIVMLTVMCCAGASGLLIYRVNHMPLDTSKNPSRQLDTEVLFGSSIGSWFMSWCSIVSVLSTGSNPPYRWTNLVYSLFIVLEKYVQNLFIIESLYRQQEDRERQDPELPAAPEVFSVTSSLAPPYNGIINRTFESPDRSCVSTESEQEESEQVYGCPRKHSDVPAPVGNETVERPNIKRQILKNIAVFLIMCNISLWILSAFGCRPQYDNGLEEETYGFSIWSTVLNFAIPLNLFYRMHAVASLFEVFSRV